MATNDDKQLNIYQRLNAVMAEVAYVQKDTTVYAGEGRKYKSVSHDAVTAALRRSFVKNGIVLHVNQNSENVIEGQTKSGFPKIRYEAWYDVTLVNMDSPDDLVAYRIHAHAEDGGDKAPGKALSYAVKMILLKAGMLESGEDDESRHLPDEPAVITDEQANELARLLDETGSDVAKFLAYFQVEDTTDLRPAQYEQALKMLQKKQAKEET